MFIYNLKFNKLKFVKIIFFVFLVIILLILGFVAYKIFFNFNTKNTAVNNSNILLSDSIKPNDIFEITPENYSTILKTVTENTEPYVGIKVHITGYIYRLFDFPEEQFVVARDMLLSDGNSQTVVIGFLSSCPRAKEFKDYDWVDVVGTIIKGNYHGDIAMLEIETIKKIDKPDNHLALPPSNTYIPTASMF